MSYGNKHFAVIGGGMAGMATAIILASRGCRVTLLERCGHLGPTLRGFTRAGIHFETGLHYAGGLSPDGPLMRYFRLLGLDGLPLEELRQDCFDRIRLGDNGREFSLPVGYDNFLEMLCSTFPEEAGFVRTYLDAMRDAFDSSVFLNFTGDFQSLLNAPANTETLASILYRGTQNPTLRAILSVHALLYGVSPEEVPFVQHARIAGSYLDGVKTVAGGGRALVAALQRRLTEEGVSVVCGVPVTGFRFASDRRISGVLLKDERHIPVDGAIFTAHPALLAPMLSGSVAKPAFVRRLAALEDTISTYTLFCKASPPIPSLQGSNLFVSRSLDVAAGFRPDRAATDGPFYISGTLQRGAQSFVVFGAGTIADYSAWLDSKPGRRPEAYKELKAARLESLRSEVLHLCPELRSMTVLDGGTPLTNRDFLGAPGGGLYGTKHSVHQFNPLPMTRIPNLWMAGQSVIAPGILSAVVSAVVACGFITGLEAMHREVALCV